MCYFGGRRGEGWGIFKNYLKNEAAVVTSLDIGIA